MSFILDALRKSEHERQRQTGPALVEVAVAPAKPRSNVWATVAIALLLVNLVAVGVFLIRKASRTPVADNAGSDFAGTTAAATGCDDRRTCTGDADADGTRCCTDAAPDAAAGEHA